MKDAGKWEGGVDVKMIVSLLSEAEGFGIMIRRRNGMMGTYVYGLLPSDIASTIVEMGMAEPSIMFYIIMSIYKTLNDDDKEIMEILTRSIGDLLESKKKGKRENSGIV